MLEGKVTMKDMKTHDVVVALVVSRKKVFLGLRSPEKNWYPSCWDLIGGHIEENETAEEALCREVWEELGVTVTDFQPVNSVPCDEGMCGQYRKDH